jgi:hypothetical protein
VSIPHPFTLFKCFLYTLVKLKYTICRHLGIAKVTIK